MTNVLMVCFTDFDVCLVRTDREEIVLETSKRLSDYGVKDQVITLIGDFSNKYNNDCKL